MSTLEQAARKALEWMEGAWYQIDCEWGPCGKTLDQACADGDAPEIEALRAALAAPQAGPVGEAVAWLRPGDVEPISDALKRADPSMYEYHTTPLVLAAPQPAAPAPERVPPGYVVVPVEPTPDMVRAGWEKLPAVAPDVWDAGCRDSRLVYAAMIAAAPSITKEPKA